MAGRILVVDDDALNREVLEAFLTMHDFQVTLAHDGITALKLVRTSPFDLLITDVRMHDMSGFQLVEHIRADDALQAIPIMIVSGFNDPEDLAEGKRVGANDFLSRPLNLKEFIARVKALVNR